MVLKDNIVRKRIFIFFKFSFDPFAAHVVAYSSESPAIIK